LAILLKSNGVEGNSEAAGDALGAAVCVLSPGRALMHHGALRQRPRSAALARYRMEWITLPRGVSIGVSEGVSVVGVPPRGDSRGVLLLVASRSRARL